MNIKKLHLPSVGVMTLVIGGILRLFAMVFQWRVELVLISEVLLLISVAWLLFFDVFPLFIPFFKNLRDNFPRKHTFFFILIALFAVLQLITTFLPSGEAKDGTTTLAFLSFISSIIWIIAIYIITTFTPIIKYMRITPKQTEKITFADIITSLAIIIFPTIALSFFFSPPGLGAAQVTPRQVFLTSLLTDIFIGAYIFLFVIRQKVFTWRQLGLRKVEREDYSRAFVLFVLVGVIVAIIQGLLIRLGVSLQQYSFSSDEGAYLALAVTVFVTPFIEELYFRGFLFKGLLLHHRPWVAYGASALIFALLHPPLIAMAEVFIMGILLAYIVKETKSIWPAVFIHMVNNALVFGYLLYK